MAPSDFQMALSGSNGPNKLSDDTSRLSEGPVRFPDVRIMRSDGPISAIVLSEGSVRLSEGPVRLSEGPVRLPGAGGWSYQAQMALSSSQMALSGSHEGLNSPKIC